MPESLAQQGALPPDVTATVVTVGTFDGVHRGHQDVLRRLADRAAAASLRSLLVTFDPHPLEIVRPEAAPPLLTVGDEKLELLAAIGIDYVMVVPFTPALAAFPPERFVDEILLGRARMSELLMGYDHGFGRGRTGDVEVLRALGSERGFRVDVVEPVRASDSSPLSSSSIRRSVVAGDLGRVREALGRHYSVIGRVQHGDGRGRELGFRTINLGAAPRRKLLPPQGVYAVRVMTPSGIFGGMMNLGPRPTFDDSATSLEAHLFDAEVELYGAQVRVDLVARLRDIMRFPDAASLVQQLRTDEFTARRALTLPV
jgi:riboflavin kinase / FMN adenylyltransferase